eukprot:gene25620-31991_t
MSDTPPDRLSVNPNSPYYDEALLSRGVGILFNGEEKTNVDEYCISEGWVRVSVGKQVARKERASPPEAEQPQGRFKNRLTPSFSAAGGR